MLHSFFVHVTISCIYQNQPFVKKELNIYDKKYVSTYKKTKIDTMVILDRKENKKFQSKSSLLPIRIGNSDMRHFQRCI